MIGIRLTLAVILFHCAVAASLNADVIGALKTRLNRLKVQQDVQIGGYRSSLAASTGKELENAVIGQRDVYVNCELSLRGLRYLFESVDDPACTQAAPHSPDSLTDAVSVDLWDCLISLENSFESVIGDITEELSQNATESWRLYFWLQPKVFTNHSVAFEPTQGERDIFRMAVLWDNVQSVRYYESVRGLAKELYDVGSFGFVCALNAYNRMFGRLKMTEEYLNINCGGQR